MPSCLSLSRSQLGRACAALGCALALLASCPAARAQPADPAAVAESDDLILQGLKLREQGQDAGALLLFERAQQLAPTPRALTQRALAEQALGSWVQAEAHLKEALAAPADAWIEQHRATLERSLATIGDHLGTLQVNGGLPGAELFIDGQQVGTLPLAASLRVVVGRSMLEVKLPGHYPVRREIAVRAGSISTETIELVPVPVPAQPAPGAEPKPAAGPAPSAAAYDATAEVDTASGLPPWLFWTSAAVTVALGGVTVWSGLNTKAQDDAWRSYTEMDGAVREEGERGYERAHDAQVRTNVLIGATAGMAAVTTVLGLLFTDWGGDGEAEPTATGVSAYGGSSGYGVTLAGRF